MPVDGDNNSAGVVVLPNCAVVKRLTERAVH